MLGVATTFGTLAKLEQVQVALMTLLIAAAIYVFLYRGHGDRTFKVHRIFLFVLTSLFVLIALWPRLRNFVVAKAISESTGIVAHYHKANDFLPKLSDHISKAEHDVWFIGVSFYITLPANKDLIIKRLTDGVAFRFLVRIPEASSCLGSLQSFDKRETNLGPSARSPSTISFQIHEQWRQTQQGSLQIRLLANPPKARMYIFDRRVESGFTFFIPQVDNVNSPNVPGFLARVLAQRIVSRMSQV